MNPEESPAPRFQPWSIWLVIGVVLGGALVAWNYMLLRHDQAARQAENPRPAFKDRVETNLLALNDKGEEVRMADLKGSTYIVSQVFTRCPGQCAGVAEKLRELQTEFGDDPNFKIVTFTIDPAHDDPAQLRKFRETFKLEGDNWWFLTGDPEKVRDYTLEEFQFRVEEKPEEERITPGDVFKHDTKVVLVDENAYIRGWYDAFIDESLEALYDDTREVLAESMDPAKRAEEAKRGIYLMLYAILAVVLAFVIIFGIRNRIKTSSAAA